MGATRRNIQLELALETARWYGPSWALASQSGRRPNGASRPGARPVQGAGPGDDALYQERQPRPPRHGVLPLPRRVAGLLWLLRDSLGTAFALTNGSDGGSGHRLAAVEAWAYPLCGAAPPRHQQAPGGANRQQCPWAMADQQQPRALLRAPQRLLRPAWPRIPPMPSSRLNPSNRRVRTRMHGGVGGVES